MKAVLVLNAGSSSLKFALYPINGDVAAAPAVSGQVEGIGATPEVTLKTIQFKTAVSQPAISSTVCVLSNEMHSPIFEKRGAKMDHAKTRTLCLGETEAIRSI